MYQAYEQAGWDWGWNWVPLGTSSAFPGRGDSAVQER